MPAFVEAKSGVHAFEHCPLFIRQSSSTTELGEQDFAGIMARLPQIDEWHEYRATNR